MAESFLLNRLRAILLHYRIEMYLIYFVYMKAFQPDGAIDPIINCYLLHVNIINDTSNHATY